MHVHGKIKRVSCLVSLLVRKLILFHPGPFFYVFSAFLLLHVFNFLLFCFFFPVFSIQIFFITHFNLSVRFLVEPICICLSSLGIINP